MKTAIINGHVIDPANRVDALLNLLIENGKIIGTSRKIPTADHIIDAAGKIVTPGFIDIHMHEDPLDKNGEIKVSIFDCMVKMGVTTAVAGNCGTNVADPLKYLDLCDMGVPCNVAMLAGHSYMREVNGATDKYSGATEDTKRAIERSLEEALDGGCCGISFGLRYVPGTGRDEFYRAAAVCKGTGKPITAHVRDDADYIFGAIEEMCETAETFGLPLQISHIGSMAGFGQMTDVLTQLDIKRLNGLDVTSDCYPYDAFCTELGATTYDEGWLERYHCDYNVLEYCEGEWAGIRADEESFKRLRLEYPDMLTVCHVMRKSDIDAAMRHPSVLIGSDGILNNGQGHPRAAGTFPRVFSQYVRSGIISLNDAVAKMTSMPAERMLLKNKGRLNVGADADITIFDYDTIEDHASFSEPTRAPTGIDTVLIGGKTAVRNGVVVDEKLGRAVRI